MLDLHTLSPSKLSLRLPVDAEFPFEEAPRGKGTWFYLDSLHPGQRYEVRICWLATQPTAFSLTTYTISEILDSPALLSSLTAGVAEDKRDMSSEDKEKHQLSPDHDTSSLFLLLESAADYFTHNEALMKTVPPVQADIILDPYLFNMLPKSLILTVGYLVIVAVAGWFASGYVWSVVKGAAWGDKKCVPDEKKRD